PVCMRRLPPLCQPRSTLFPYTPLGRSLQFLKRSSEALDNYEQAIGIYREVGSRLGEANVLQELGKLQDSAEDTLAHLQHAQEIYVSIGDGYSQCRNAVRFLADTHLKLGQNQSALAILRQVADLAKGTEYDFYQQQALEKIETICEQGG
ncbi:MAG: tetratricopeptide repeat protein, partial [Cyanobacteria bacterium P01_A01_bin.114]